MLQLVTGAWRLGNMDKVCPFMSRCKVDKHGDHITAEAICIKNRCMAWEPENITTLTKNDGTVVMQKPIPGYCKRIENREKS